MHYNMYGWQDWDSNETTPKSCLEPSSSAVRARACGGLGVGADLLALAAISLCVACSLASLVLVLVITAGCLDTIDALGPRGANCDEGMHLRPTCINAELTYTHA